MSIIDYTPRPTQRGLILDVVERLKTNDDTALIASTGSGKTISCGNLIAYYAQKFNPKKDGTLNPRAWTHGNDFKHIIFIVHMDNLVQQTYQKFQGVFQSRVLHMGKLRETNMHHGITYIKSGLPFDQSKPIVIASLQTLSKRYEHYINSGWLNPAMLIFDECHTTAFCDTGRKLIEELDYQKRLGLTATPFRLEKDVSFSDLWSNCVVSPSFGEMVRRGELCPITYKQFVSAEEISTLKKSKTGDFSDKDALLRFNTPERIKFAVDKWEQHAKERPTIVFTIDVAHGEAVKQQFCERGYVAEVVSYKTESKDREPIYKRYALGQIQVLISVRALAVGFDEPSCSCGIDLQPTTSISNHWQKIGRVARLHPGKTKALWLDFTGNIENLLYFGCPNDVDMTEESVMSTKDFTKREGDAPKKFCPQCNTVNHASSKNCSECGFLFPTKSIVDATPAGDLVTIITKSMVVDSSTAKAYYRSLRHKRYIRNQHPNAAYHEYINTEPIATDFPIPHPRDRVSHKLWTLGCVTGQPDNYDKGIEFLDNITKLVRKYYKDTPTITALIDSAIWLEFNDDVYEKLKLEINNYDTRQKLFIENLLVNA